MPTVSYQPWYTGCQSPPWDIPLQNDAGNEDITLWDITTFTMTFQKNGVDTPGTGTFSKKVSYPNPEVYYHPSVADVANTFNGKLFVKAINPADGLPAVWDPVDPFVITQS